MATSGGATHIVSRAVGGIAGKSARSVRVTVVLCLVAIAGSFAAAAALEMRLERAHSLQQASWFEARRATSLATVANETLDRYADQGRAFANDDNSALVLSGIANIAVFTPSGEPERILHPGRTEFDALPAGWLARATHQRRLLRAVLAFADKGSIIAVAFDPSTLVPQEMLEDARLTDEHGLMLAGADTASDAKGPSSEAHDWPLTARTFVDADAALAAWRGLLPLYLFVIIGPALAGACLAAIFVGAFERHMRAAQAIKALRTARPAERRLLVRLASAERRGVEGVRAKSEFIAHMSHELRTPLNAVIGFAEVIEKGLFGPTGHPKYIEYAHDIAEAGRGLHAKIGDILEYGNVEAGLYPIRRQHVDLAGIARNAANEHEGKAFASAIGIEVAPGGPVLVNADPQALKRVLSLLIENSLRYGRKGGRIRMDIHLESNSAVLRMRDMGVGFTDMEKLKAGEAFLTFEREGKRQGAGLGLAIAMALMRRMGGALVVGGYHGLGATIELRLPVQHSP
jgi:signal transduction histidine kinase